MKLFQHIQDFTQRQKKFLIEHGVKNVAAVGGLKSPTGGTFGAGFTLLETIIALAIVVAGGLAVFSLLSQTVRTSTTSEKDIAAVNLAREGLEIVRSIRDSSAVGTGFAALANGAWIIDSNDAYSVSIPANNSSIHTCNNCRLYLTNNQYSHTVSGGSQTPYKRLVFIADANPVHVSCAGAGVCEKVITVEVLRDGSSEVYTIINYLTDWQ